MSFFTGDSYHTKSDEPRLILDKLALNTRFYFFAGYFGIVLDCRRQALKGVFDTKAWASASFDIFKLVEGCGGRFHISGLDNLKKCQGPVVFVSNHMSTLETQIFPCIIAPVMEVTYVVKESLIRHPFMGPVLSSRDPIVVGRTNSREDLQTVLTKGQDLLAKGTSIIVFPQSTRTTEFVPEQFNSLGIKLASRAKVQVVPVAIKTDFWANGKLVRDVGPIDRSKPIHMAFGEPFDVVGNGKEEHRKVIEFISRHLEEWAGE